MDIDEFMDITKPVKMIHIPVTNQRNKVWLPKAEKDKLKIDPKARKGDAYANELKQEQEIKMRRTMRLNASQSTINNTTNILNASFSDFDEEANLPASDYHRKFKGKKSDCDLPVMAHQEKILTTIRNNPIVVIKGDTGCGKSTQVPQMILDEAIYLNEHCNIMVTQPRRIAAVSLAQYVARQRGCIDGTLVGHQIGLDRVANDETRLLYCTTGVALQKLIAMKHMRNFTHIIIDEVHERDEEMEFLLIITKLLFVENSQNTKIILMSATFDTDEFARYFETPSGREMVKAPTISLKTKRQYEIHEFFIDNVQELAAQAIFDYAEPGIDPTVYHLAGSLVSTFYSWHVNNLSTNPESLSPTILIFLPGIQEIQEMHKVLDVLMTTMKLKIIMLHSSIASEQQKDVFKNVAEGYVKVILATNIAESSITVPNVAFIIDFCLTRILEVDNSTGFAKLKLRWASRNNLKQRAGRTGRTCKGRVYRLIHRDFYKNGLDEAEPSALQRCSLEKIILKCKALKIGLPPYKILGLAVNPPDKTDIENAIVLLKETRGLHLLKNDVFDLDDGDMTFMGQIMEALPLDIRATRLIVLGYMFSVIDECIIMAAGISVQKIFKTNLNDPMRVYNQKLVFSDGSGSDLFAILHAYQFWLRRIHDNRHVNEHEKERAAAINSLDMKGLNEMHQLIQDISRRLEQFKLLEAEGQQRITLSDREKNIIIKVCIAGAFYPNYFLRKSVTSGEQERMIFHELNGRNPCNTVYYKGIDSKKFPLLYIEQIKRYMVNNKIVASADEVKVSVDEGAHKIYVTFDEKTEVLETNNDAFETSPNPWMPGQVKIEVYKALKAAREGKPLKLMILNDTNFQKDRQNIEFYFQKKEIDLNVAQLCVLPIDPFKTELLGELTKIITPNKFWFRPSSGNNERVIEAIDETMNSTRLPLKVLHPSEAYVGQIVAVKTSQLEDMNLRYHRAKIMAIYNNNGQENSYKLQLLDYGGEISETHEKIRSLENVQLNAVSIGLHGSTMIKIQSIPPRVFECTLAEIQPSYLQSTTGKWPVQAVDRFKELCTNTELIAQIYSVWNGVASVYLLDSRKTSLNRKLINLQLAEKAEECYPSKKNHAERFRVQNFGSKLNNDNNKMYVTNEVSDYLRKVFELPPQPTISKANNKALTLRGPFSPLETTIHPTTRAGKNHGADIEKSSINNIVLDTDPQEPNERLIVSCTITSSKKGLTARNTTIMPQINGFAPMMAALFAPVIEVHRDPSKSRYSSIICGLGPETPRENVKDEFKSRFPEHDVNINFDVYMDTKDMEMINKLRYTMSSLLYTLPGEAGPNLSADKKLTLKKEIRKNTMNLLSRVRKSIDIHLLDSDFKWGEVEKDDLLCIQDVYGDMATFPMFEFMKLMPEEEMAIQSYRNNNQQLHAIAFANASLPLSKEIPCLMCSKIYDNIPDLQVHLFSKLHIERAEQSHATFIVDQYRAPSRSNLFS